MLPNPIHPEKGSLAYAKAQVNEVLSFRKFVQHIADHGGYTRGKVKGVLSDMCTCLVEMLLEGKKVQLDELGNFWISLSSDGAESCEKFTANNIKAVNIVFSRSAQSATLKAEKTGKGSVDLEAAKNKANSSKNEGDGDNTPSGGTPSEGNTPSGSEGSENSGNTDNGTGEDNEL